MEYNYSEAEAGYNNVGSFIQGSLGCNMISAQASELNNAPQSRECDNFANW